MQILMDGKHILQVIVSPSISIALLTPVMKRRILDCDVLNATNVEPMVNIILHIFFLCLPLAPHR